jgi:hypothetical protein
MLRKLSHAVALGSIAASLGVLATAACVHPSTDRVLEPAGGPAGGSSASPTSPSSPLADAAVAPVGPVATAVEPDTDFHTVRAPEFGLPPGPRLAGSWGETALAAGNGGAGDGGTGGIGPTGGAAGKGGGIFR